MTITRMALSLVLGTTACGSSAARESGQVEGSNQSRDCAGDLRTAAAIDTSKLGRREVDGPPDKSAEGSTIVEFRDALQPKLLVVTYFGETGRTWYAYYFASPTSYLLRIHEERYAAPLTAESPVVADSSSRELVVCNGALRQPSDSSAYKAGKEILVQADSLLRSKR